MEGGGGDPLRFSSWNTAMFFVGIAQHSALTKNIRDMDITEPKGFPSGDEGIRDLVLAACRGRLLPNYVNLNYSYTYFE